MKLVSWNIEGRLSRFAEIGKRGSPERIVAELQRLDADIVFLPEASDGDVIEPHINAKLVDMGYKVLTVDYEGTGERKWTAEDAPNMKLLSRIKIKNFTQFRLGDLRNALSADVVNENNEPYLRIFGVHLDDRLESNRLKQIDDLIVRVNKSPLPCVVMGDWNAMHGESRQARVLRTSIVQCIINIVPLPRFRHVLQRLCEMGIGETLATFESATGLRDADSTWQPTTTPKMRFQEWLPSIRMVQIDHIYVSPTVNVSDFAIAPDGGSDHRSITAVV